MNLSLTPILNLNTSTKLLLYRTYHHSKIACIDELHTARPLDSKENNPSSLAQQPDNLSNFTMKNSFSFIVTSLFLILTLSNAQARETLQHFPLADALNNNGAAEKLDDSVGFYFGDSGHPAVTKKYGEFMSNKKTNAFNKTDKYACEWAFLSAMLSFHDRARGYGANAVINIKSFYKRNDYISSSEYECGAGNIIAGVTFVGEIVTLGEGPVIQTESSTDTPQSSASAAPSSESNKIKTAQNLLILLGYDIGPADGFMDVETNVAIAKYQKQQGISITGELDSETLLRMGIK